MFRSNTHIGRLKTRGGSQGALLQRLRLERLLNDADMRPAGMPPRVILFVRRLADPLPGQLAAQPGSLRASPRWQAAAQNSLAQAYRQAVRPQSGAPSSNAQVVCFADEAEMVACLALDLLAGRAAECWWWQVILRHLPGPGKAALAAVFHENARSVPAIFKILSGWGQAAAVAAAVAPAQAGALTLELAEAYQLVEILAHLKGAPGDRLTPPASPTLAIRPDETPASQAPWQAWLPRPSGSLAPEQLCWMGISLGLAQHPRWVQSWEFAQALLEWLCSHSSEPAGRSPLISAVPPIQSPARLAATPIPAEESSLSSPTLHLSASAHALPEDSPPAAQETSLARRLGLPAPDPAVGTALQPAPSDLKQMEGRLTHLAGVLYLINVMRTLDLPGCFEESWRLSSQVGAWGVLELLARALLGEAQTGLRNDPIWSVLAELDGRPAAQLPGADFSGLGSDLLPPGWVLTAHAAPADGTRSADTAWLQGVHPRLLRWLDLVMPSIRGYLTQALQLAEGENLADRLLCFTGRLYMSPTHVDLFMSLETISLPVRMTGLDFDPGWQPLFGRVVQFHFD